MREHGSNKAGMVFSKVLKPVRAITRQNLSLLAATLSRQPANNQLFAGPQSNGLIIALYSVLSAPITRAHSTFYVFIYFNCSFLVFPRVSCGFYS